MGKMIDRLERFANSFSKWLNWVAGIGLVGMLGLIVADIIGIKIFKHPIPGAIEVVAFFGVVVTAFAIAYTQVLRGHIKVEFFVMRLPTRVQAIIASFVLLLGMPVGFSMALVGLAGFCYLASPQAGLSIPARDVFATLSSYSLIVIP